ncbi:hypothetical protein CVT26_010409 [Gymnopilus dilepis]|uniref:Hypervirulence associated protein TUDOR domain-containing protein n=1 Tax=Gymnopilus dilepis TaxID=231916 RepID=A0A409W4U9_9AGAR|nr:hypothetical protein CVT26_010409 [Gymnopilus dilepis]
MSSNTHITRWADGTRVKVTQGHQAPSTAWIAQGKKGTVQSSMVTGTYPNLKLYYNIKWDDGTSEPYVLASMLSTA